MSAFSVRGDLDGRGGTTGAKGADMVGECYKLVVVLDNDACKKSDDTADFVDVSGTFRGSRQ